MISKYKFSLIILILLNINSSFAKDGSSWENKLNIPNWVKTEFTKQNLYHLYSYDFAYNPFYLRGDFDGDAQTDIALMVSDKISQKKGIIIFHFANKKTYILGAGKNIDNGGDDFSWLTNWSVYRNPKVKQGAPEGKPPKLKGEAIFLEKQESASALIYWNENSYTWYQQGD